MIESDWFRSADPRAMLSFLAERASERKLRLFYCACCRRVWNLIIDERGRQAVVAAERFAEGLVDESELQVARHSARRAVCDAKRTQWIAEADAEFVSTPEYCRVSAMLYAQCAALAAASASAASAHGGWEYYQDPEIIDPLPDFDPPRASNYWAAAAVGVVRQGQVLAGGELDDCHPVVLVARTEWLEEYLRESRISWPTYLLKLQAREANSIACAAEAAEQADLLRRLFDNPFQVNVDGIEAKLGSCREP